VEKLVEGEMGDCGVIDVEEQLQAIAFARELIRWASSPANGARDRWSRLIHGEDENTIRREERRRRRKEEGGGKQEAGRRRQEAGETIFHWSFPLVICH
jgi:hypothetical protein